MFKIFRNEKGTLSLRPMYIGRIKNNYVRRIVCTLVYPITLVACMLSNVLQCSFIFLMTVLVACLKFVYNLYMSFYTPIKGMKWPWNNKIWNEPRKKGE